MIKTTKKRFFGLFTWEKQIDISKNGLHIEIHEEKTFWDVFTYSSDTREIYLPSIQNEDDIQFLFIRELYEEIQEIVRGLQNGKL